MASIFAASDSDFTQRLRSALALDLGHAHDERLKSEGGREAAVLLIFGTKDGVRSLLVTRRAERVEPHSGQMAFPGGRCEDDETRSVTALRETEEEVGISRHCVQVIGELPPLSTVTGFRVTPIVGVLEGSTDTLELRLSQQEVAAAYWIPLEKLMAEGTHQHVTLTHESLRYTTHVYQVDDLRIWGATAAIIKNLLDRLRAVG